MSNSVSGHGTEANKQKRHANWRPVNSYYFFPLALTTLVVLACQAKPPSTLEQKIVREIKEQITIGGKDWQNPIPDNKQSVKHGAEHFQHHCQICHGLDGQNTGVPFANKMSPPVADLASKNVQEYTDGQLKWIIENGIRYTGMPGWKGIIEDQEMWHIVRYVRHLPPKGSVGIPAVYKEAVRTDKKAAKKTESPESKEK